MPHTGAHPTPETLHPTPHTLPSARKMATFGSLGRQAYSRASSHPRAAPPRCCRCRRGTDAAAAGTTTYTRCA